MPVAIELETEGMPLTVYTPHQSPEVRPQLPCPANRHQIPAESALSWTALPCHYLNIDLSCPSLLIDLPEWHTCPGIKI